MEMMNYLYAIRRRLISVIVVFAFGVVLGLVFYQKILQVIIFLFQLNPKNLVFTSPTEVLSLMFNIAIFCGVVLSFPYFIYQLLSLVKPALTKKEYHFLVTLLPTSGSLLIAGLVFGVWVMRFTVSLYQKASLSLKIGNFWGVERFLSQMILTSISTALLFQLPIILSALIRFGLVKKAILREKRPYIWAILLILAVLLPPTDPLSLIILTLPLLLLFEITLLLNPGRA